MANRQLLGAAVSLQCSVSALSPAGALPSRSDSLLAGGDDARAAQQSPANSVEWRRNIFNYLSSCARSTRSHLNGIQRHTCGSWVVPLFKSTSVGHVQYSGLVDHVEATHALEPLCATIKRQQVRPQAAADRFQGAKPIQYMVGSVPDRVPERSWRAVVVALAIRALHVS